MHFPTTVPGQRASQLYGELAYVTSKSSNDDIGVPTRQFNERGKTRVALNQGGNLTMIPAEQQVSFPMPRTSSVISLCRPFPDRDRIDDLAASILLLRYPRATQPTLAAQVTQQLLFQCPS